MWPGAKVWLGKLILNEVKTGEDSQNLIQSMKNVKRLEDQILPKNAPFKTVFWVPGGAQLVKHPALDFSSGHDLKVVGTEPHLGFPLSGVSA